LPSGTATFNITGAGANTSTLNAGFVQAGQNPGGFGVVNVNTLSTVNVGTNLIVGLDPAGAGRLNVSGASAVVNAPGFVTPFPNTDSGGDPVPGGDGAVTVSNGGVVNLSSFGAAVALNPQQTGTLTISGANSKVLSSGTAELDVAVDGSGTLNINSGGMFSSGGVSAGNGNAFFAANPDATANGTVNAGTLLVGGQLQIGGSGGTDGGTATLSATNGGHIQSNDLAVVYTPGTLNIGSGTNSPARFIANSDVAVDGHINYNSGTFN